MADRYRTPGAYLRAGDELVVCKLDRLGRSVSHLVNVVEDLADRASSSSA